MSRKKLLSLTRELLYPSFVLDHLNYKSLKIALRTWICIWFGCILTAIEPVNQWLGGASFVVMLGGVMNPAGNMSIIETFIVGILNVMFALYSVAVCAIASAIIWHVNGHPTQAQVMADLAAQGICEGEGLTCFRNYIAEGHLISAKSAFIAAIAELWALFSAGLLANINPVLYGPFLFVVINSTMTLPQVANTPYFTIWNSAKISFIPLAISQAIRFFFACIVFPISSLSKVTRNVISASQTVDSYMCEVLEFGTRNMPSDAKFFDEFDKKSRKKMGSIMRANQQVAVDGIYSRYELSFSRFDRSDLGVIRDKVLRIANAVNAFRFPITDIIERKRLADVVVDDPDDVSSIDTIGTFTPAKIAKKSKKYVAAAEFEKAQLFDYYLWHSNRYGTQETTVECLDALFTTLVKTWGPVMDAIHDLYTKQVKWLDSAEKFDYRAILWPSYRRKCMKAQRDNETEISSAVNRLIDLWREAPVPSKVYKHFIEHDTSDSEFHRKYVLGQISGYFFLVEKLSQRVMNLSDYLLHVDGVQPAPATSYPFQRSRRLEPDSYFELSTFNQAGKSSSFGIDWVDDACEIIRVQRRNPDVGPSYKWFHKYGKYLLKVLRTIRNEDMLFSLRRASFTVFAMIPCLVRTTAPWAAHNRLIWVAVMTGLAVEKRLVDGVYGFIMKLSFTALGSLVGMVGWYICAGTGRGNPYGYCAVMAFIIFYITWHRHFTHHMTPVGSILLGITLIFVPGTCWSLGHNTNPGVQLTPGWNVAWIRLVTCIVGQAIAFIGTIFPKLITGKKSVRLIFGNVLGHMSQIQTEIMNFAVLRYHSMDVHITQHEDVVSKDIIRLFEDIAVAERLTATIRFEPPLVGSWPKNHYRYLTHTLREILHIYWLFYYVVNEVGSPESLEIICQEAQWTNPQFVASIFSGFYMMSNALVTAQPLPTITSQYLSKRFLSSLNVLDQADIEHNITDPDTQMSIVVVVFCRLLYERLDKLMLVVKGLVGENFDTDPRIYGLKRSVKRKAE